MSPTLAELTEKESEVLRDVVETFHAQGYCRLHGALREDEREAVERLHVMGLVEIRPLHRDDPRESRVVTPTGRGRALVS